MKRLLVVCIAAALLVGCSGSSEVAVPDVVGMNLQDAQDAMQRAGFYDLYENDATGQGRSQLMDRLWDVVSQSPAAGTMADPESTQVDLNVTRPGE